MHAVEHKQKQGTINMDACATMSRRYEIAAYKRYSQCGGPLLYNSTVIETRTRCLYLYIFVQNRGHQVETEDIKYRIYIG